MDEFITSSFRKNMEGGNRLYYVMLFQLYEENKYIDPYCLVSYVPYDILSKLNIEQHFEILPKFDSRTGFHRKAHFEKILLEYFYNVRYYGESIKNKILNDFDRFTEIYDVLFKDRKNFISHQLVLYLILKHNNLECEKSEFKRLKLCHMDICNTVFEKLNCSVKKNKFIYKMEAVVETFVKYVIENCKTEEEIRYLLETVEKAIAGSDTCDQNNNTCCYVIKKGKLKGQLCEKSSKSQFCSKHTKRVYNFESQSEDS